MSRDVYVAGVGMHPFMRNAPSCRDMYFTAAMETMKDAGIKFQDVGALYNGYIGGEMMEGVSFAKDLGLTNVPIVHVENASATGSCAFREAVNAVKGGECDIAMAVGYDDMIKFTRSKAISAMAGPPKIEQTILPAAFFAMWATRRMHEAGTTVETFAKIAAKNWNHARHNKYAQRQSKNIVTPEEILAANEVSYPHTTKMACAAGGGAAGAVVVSKEIAKKLANGRPLVKVTGSQAKSEHYTDGHVFLGAVIGPEDLTRVTTQALYEESGIGPDDVDLVHVHDAFPIEELMYYELMGFCGEGEGDRMVADGETSIGGRIPFSTDGGLTARGHPGGPTGLAQVWDAVTQLRGESDKRQVEGAQNAMVHMMGAGSICIMHMLQKEG
ncbi:MAG: thiolase family protein [Pseudomonadales bacterium]|nr:thiolase family protein [Pseudomonadales bacterium]